MKVLRKFQLLDPLLGSTYHVAQYVVAAAFQQHALRVYEFLRCDNDHISLGDIQFLRRQRLARLLQAFQHHMYSILLANSHL